VDLTPNGKLTELNKATGFAMAFFTSKGIGSSPLPDTLWKTNAAIENHHL